MPGRDPNHWLYRYSADEWLSAGMRELTAAKRSIAMHASRQGLASARRAAGMGWNAVLALHEVVDERFGRTYVEHLRALADGISPLDSWDFPVPDEVRDAARRLLEDAAAGPRDVVQILTPKRDERLLDAAETVLAEAYARVARAKAMGGPRVPSRPPS